jgi:hypothetical protein
VDAGTTKAGGLATASVSTKVFVSANRGGWESLVLEPAADDGTFPVGATADELRGRRVTIRRADSQLFLTTAPGGVLQATTEKVFWILH